MKHMLQWFVIYFIGAISLSLLAVGLVAGGAVLQFKALILVLTPLVGPAAAYALTGLACFAIVLLMLLALSSKARTHRHTLAAATAHTNTPLESSLMIVKKYPLESVMVAFAAGLSSGDPEELKKLATRLLQEA
ncbi:MAG TPA: hypothetical protein VM553_07165 [Dongiaceae bacterium]|nr:hypothetical protein [Dongiaceae bacterium]